MKNCLFLVSFLLMACESQQRADDFLAGIIQDLYKKKNFTTEEKQRYFSKDLQRDFLIKEEFYNQEMNGLDFKKVFSTCQGNKCYVVYKLVYFLGVGREVEVKLSKMAKLAFSGNNWTITHVQNLSEFQDLKGLIEE